MDAITARKLSLFYFMKPYIVLGEANFATDWESSPLSTMTAFCKDGKTEACTPWFPMLRTLFNLNKALALAACMHIGTGLRYSGGSYIVAYQNFRTSKATLEG